MFANATKTLFVARPYTLRVRRRKPRCLWRITALLSLGLVAAGAFLLYYYVVHDTLDAASPEKLTPATARAENVQVLPEGPDVDPDSKYYYHRAVQAAQEHAEWQNAILNSDPSAPENEHSQTRFLIFSEVPTGMGNRLEAAISAYLYAMITKRVYVLRNNTFGTAMDFPLHPIQESDARVQHHLELAGEEEHTVDIETAVRICEDIASENYPLMRHRKLVLTANMYFGDLLFYNPYLRPWLDERFGPRKLNENNPFRPLFRWFVRLKPFVQEIVDTVKQQHHFQDTTVIGLQIRMTESYASMTQMDTFWDCAVDKAAKQLSNSNGAKEVRYFLSTDNPAVQTAAKERFGEHVFWRSNLTKTISTSQHRDLADAIADVTLLAGCHGLVVTQASSFGRLAYASSIMSGGEPPWFVTVNSKHTQL